MSIFDRGNDDSSDEERTEMVTGEKCRVQEDGGVEMRSTEEPDAWIWTDSPMTVSS